MAPKSSASPASSASTYESDDEEEVAPPKSAAVKPSPAAVPKPDSSSSDDEGESGSSDDEAVPAAAAAAESGSESGSESDDEPAAAAATPKSAAAATPKPDASSSGEESGSGDDSDSDSDAAPSALPRHSARVADPAVKPLASKPMPPKLAAASEPPSAKQFHRIWSDEDQLALLTGILNYKASTGILPSTNSEIEAFKDVILKSLRVEVTTTQLADKVRHLKRKYTRTKASPPTSAKPHDTAMYELSQKVWGAKRERGENGDASGSRAKKRQKSGEGRDKVENKEVAVVAVDEAGDPAPVTRAAGKVRYPYFTDAVLRMGDSVQSRFLVKEAIESVDDAKASALESKYKKLKLQQMKSNVRELDLNKEALKAVTDAMEKYV